MTGSYHHIHNPLAVTLARDSVPPQVHALNEGLCAVL